MNALVSLILVAVTVPLLSGCGADDALGAAAPDANAVDATAGSDTSQVSDTSAQDTTAQEVASETAADGREIEGPLIGLKPDPSYLVPGNIAAKTDVAAAGDLVAWVEGPSDAPLLVVWDLKTPEIGPRAFVPPTLLHPRNLALSDRYLVYVDDRYGDPDVFAIDLASNEDLVVASRPGAQEAPAVFGSRVAWEDCSACVTGDGAPGHEAGREIHERDLAAGPERRLTTDASADRRPSYGLLRDGQPALSWVSGRATLRLERLVAGVSATLDVQASLRADQEVGAVVPWEGMLAWRPSPLIVNPDSMIVNPDSMYPSDVLTTDLEDWRTAALTVHAELAGRMTLTPRAFGPRLAWLEIPPGSAGTGRVQLAGLGAEPTTVAEASGVGTFAMGRDFIVFSAHRADNDGEPDVQVLRLELP